MSDENQTAEATDTPDSHFKYLVCGPCVEERKFQKRVDAERYLRLQLTVNDGARLEALVEEPETEEASE